MRFFDIADNKSTYTDFKSIKEIELFYQNNYVPFDPCFVGDLVSIEVFIGASYLYGFTTEYRCEDVSGIFKLTSGSSFDIQRNKQREVLTNRQVGFINKAVEDYQAFWNEINRIYTTGIYSPCYAEPGWSEGTWYLNQLRIAFTEKDDVAEFPYDDVNIIPEPPE